MANFEEIFHQALEQHQSGHLEDAKQHYIQLLKAQPDHVEVLDLMGVLLNQQGSPAESLPFFERALQKTTDNATLHVHTGNALCSLQRFEEALQHFTTALNLKPQYAEAHNNCGNVYLRQEKYEKAIEHYQQAMALKPDYYDARCNLALAYCQLDELKKADDVILAVLVEQPHHPTANRYQQIINDEIAIAQFIDKALHGLHQGKVAEAVEYYQQVLRIQPDNPLAGYHLAALKGQSNYGTAPPTFVANLFNHYAHHYDTHLKETLRYQVPSILYEHVKPLLPSNGQSILDLGCGTGIIGEIFARHGNSVVGVDLAQSMLTEAQKKTCYTELHCDDLFNYLEKSPDYFDLILAADVFVYMGKLEAIFAAISQHLHPKGLFAFSIETLSSGDYTLLPTARFAHHPAYIKKLAQQYDFAVVKNHSCTLREQQGKAIEGMIFVLQQP